MPGEVFNILQKAFGMSAILKRTVRFLYAYCMRNWRWCPLVAIQNLYKDFTIRKYDSWKSRQQECL